MGNFAENLREEMTRRDKTAKDLGKLTGISYRTIEGWLDARENTPRVNEAYQAAAALEISVEFLVTGKQPGYWRPPVHIAPIVDDLLTLDAGILRCLGIMIHAIAMDKRSLKEGISEAGTRETSPFMTDVPGEQSKKEKASL